jgi:(2Fe-2S) ferredoxin
LLPELIKPGKSIKKAVAKKTMLDVELVEVGCIGYCEVEPVVDVKMPGKARISFSGVTEDSARKIVEEFIMNNDFSGIEVLGQYNEDDSEKYPDVPIYK